MIHGQKKRPQAGWRFSASASTGRKGCIALRNEHMDILWRLTPLGTLGRYPAVIRLAHDLIPSPLALILWLSVATLTGTRLWFVYPDFTLAVFASVRRLAGDGAALAKGVRAGAGYSLLFVRGHTEPHPAGLGAVADVVSALAMPPQSALSSPRSHRSHA